MSYTLVVFSVTKINTAILRSIPYTVLQCTVVALRCTTHGNANADMVTIIYNYTGIDYHFFYDTLDCNDRYNTHKNNSIDNLPAEELHFYNQALCVDAF